MIPVLSITSRSYNFTDYKIHNDINYDFPDVKYIALYVKMTLGIYYRQKNEVHFYYLDEPDDFFEHPNLKAYKCENILTQMLNTGSFVGTYTNSLYAYHIKRIDNSNISNYMEIIDIFNEQISNYFGRPYVVSHQLHENATKMCLAGYNCYRIGCDGVIESYNETTKEFDKVLIDDIDACLMSNIKTA